MGLFGQDSLLLVVAKCGPCVCVRGQRKEFEVFVAVSRKEVGKLSEDGRFAAALAAKKESSASSQRWFCVGRRKEVLVQAVVSFGVDFAQVDVANGEIALCKAHGGPPRLRAAPVTQHPQTGRGYHLLLRRVGTLAGVAEVSGE